MKLKTHLLRTGRYLLYTVIYNIISFLFYFLPAFSTHEFSGRIAFVILGIAQILFSVLFFRTIPLGKAGDADGAKPNLLAYFMILSAVSIFISVYRFENSDSWFLYIFFNTYYSLIQTSFLDNIPTFIFAYLCENAVKTYCLYQNIQKKKMSKVSRIVLTVIIILLYLVFLIWLTVVRYG